MFTPSAHVSHERLIAPAGGMFGLDGGIVDQMSFVPVISPSGEIVYCLSGGMNGNVAGALPPGGSHIPGAVRLDSMQSDMMSVCAPAFLQQNGSDNMMMRRVQNGLLPLPANQMNAGAGMLQQAVDPLGNPGHFHNPFNPMQHLAKPMLVQANRDVNEALIGRKSNDVMPAMSSDQVVMPTESNTPQTNIGLLNSSSMDALSESARFSRLPGCKSVVEKFQSQITLQQHKLGSELGPVEKAVFKEALYSQNKKRIVAHKCDVCKITFATQAQSDMHFKSKKHCRAMFEQQIVKDGGIDASIPYRERTKDKMDVSENISSRNFATTMHSSTEQVIFNATKITCKERIEDAIINSTGGDQSFQIQRSSKQITRTTVHPAIRYHPYLGAADKSPRDCDANRAETSTEITKQSTDNSTDIVKRDESQIVRASSSDSSSTPEIPIHFPTSLQPRAGANDVRSVSVPKSGSYVVIKNGDLKMSASESTSSRQNEPADSDEHSPTSENDLKGNEDESKREGDHSNKSSSESDSSIVNEDAAIPSDSASRGSSPGYDSSSSSSGPKDGEDDDGATSPKRRDSPVPQREVNLPDPLPSYITKVDRPPGRVLKESLHCTTCDVYVNSENQMKQHINSLRHKNTLQGIPTPPKPGRDEKPKLRAEQYRCSICKVTLNSDIQLSQHLSSQRHKNMLDGKPPKPRWSPYERTQQALLHSAATLRLPFKQISSQSILPQQQTAAPVASTSISIAGLNGIPRSSLPGHYLTVPAHQPAAALKQASIMIQDGGVIQAREVVYLGGPPLQALQSGATFPGAISTIPGLMPSNQPQHLQLQHVVTAPPAGMDWVTTSGLRLAT